MKKITNEVLCERMENFFRENKEEHSSIIAQTTKTNGTVTVHDRALNQLKGGFVVSNLILVPIFLYLLFKYVF